VINHDEALFLGHLTSVIADLEARVACPFAFFGVLVQLFLFHVTGR
jgi:hypothetical protein